MKGEAHFLRRGIFGLGFPSPSSYDPRIKFHETIQEITPASFCPLDPDRFFSELDDLTQRVYADRQSQDLAHLRKIERWGRFCSVLGYATAWLGVNPLSILGIALGVEC